MLPGTSLSSVGLAGNNRRTVRSEVNPYDKATIFSIFPQEIKERKITIEPGFFHILAGSPENPSRLVVGSSSWWRDIDPEQPLLEIPVSAISIADSIVRDYNNSRIGSDMGESVPGLFYLPGDISVADLKTKHKSILDAAIQKQRNWYTSLVKLADALWARSNGNPIAIDDIMRYAAKELGMTRAWLEDFKALELVNCTACGNMRNPKYPICPHCKAIVDTARAKELNLVFAQ